MSRDNVKREGSAKQDISWESLAAAADSQIQAYRKRLLALRKSAAFFRKQAMQGVPFPRVDTKDTAARVPR